jgi:EpsD family peptidyl-prolyl cis-trans isomerase
MSISACGDVGPKSSQVVAKVNDAELSVYQLSFVIQHTPGIAPERAAEARKEVLERLIDQELAVQRARETKLDRDPEIVQPIEAARREVLSNACVERAAQVPRPTPAEVEAFYRDNPLRFAERRVWRLDEILLSPPPSEWAALSKDLESARTVADAAAMLKSKGVDVPVNPGVARASEGIPLEILPRFVRLKEGDRGFCVAGGQAVIAQIRGIQPAPVDVRQSTGAIEVFLQNRRRADAARTESARLRTVAKIDYRGEFAGGAAPPVKGPAQEPGAAPAQKGLEKGIGGLK